MFRRHPILTTLVILLFLAVAVVGIFIATFDLNSYRERLQTTLGAALSRPVHLGEARLSVRHGLAIDFSDLSVGPGEGEAGVLRADHLLLKIELRPLLRRELVFSDVRLDAPRLSLTLGPATTGRPPSAAGAPSQGLLDTALIRSLKITDGTLHLIDRREPDRPYTITLEQVDAQLTGVALDRPIRIRAAGRLAQEGTSSPFALKGEVTPGANLSDWHDLGVDLALDLDHFSPAPPLQRYASDLRALDPAGTLGLQLRLSGSPASGLRFDGRIDGRNFHLGVADLYREPVAFQKIQIEGTWTTGESAQKFTGMSLKADELSFSGNFSLENRKEGLWLEGELASQQLPLSRISELIPDRNEGSSAARLRKSLGGGSLEIVSARFDGPLTELGLPSAFLLRKAEVDVRDAVLRLDGTDPLRDLSFIARWEDDRLTLSEGTGTFLDSPTQFSATVLHPLRPAVEVQLAAAGTLPLQPLLALLPAQLPKKLRAEGPCPLDLKVEGSPDRLVVDLRADLQRVVLGWEEAVAKPAGSPGNLFLTGEITPDHAELSHGRLKIPLLEGRFQANLNRGKKKDFRTSLDLTLPDLRKLAPLLPVLERMEPRGEISLHYELAGAGREVKSRQGTAYLRRFGMHIGGPLADLNNASGQVLLRPDHAEFERFSAELGASPVHLDGSISNFADPLVDLHVRAATIRADELIFPSDQAVLRDVDGHLIINRGGILFDPVEVHLDGGTVATVRGSLRDFKSPQVTLDIASEWANIDEVIGLWHHPEKEPGPSGTKEKRKVSLMIHARVAEGVLGPLHFQNAAGEIGLPYGVLTIFPLRFEAGAGRCTGRVVVDRQANGASLLKISGHLENFDAEAMQTELLKHRWLVTGTLRGDFYLEGEAGSRFLPTSMGGFNLEVKNGVLRKFRFLSKVFSILNVSQILTFKLPDMAQEGMPFKRLKGNFALQDGVLSTEDLFVDSNAMNLSLVGDDDLVKQKLDLVLGLKPLRTVDKIVTQIPLAGWILTGEEKALITAYFKIKGDSNDPEVTAIPITSVSEKALGIFKRVLGLPGKVITDMGDLLEGEKK